MEVSGLFFILQYPVHSPMKDSEDIATVSAFSANLRSAI